MPRTTLERIVQRPWALVLAGCMAHGGSTMSEARSAQAPFSAGTKDAVVRYQAQDVDRSIAFYTKQLGFELTQRAGPVGIISRGSLHLLLSGPGASGSRPMPDGHRQEPGGWNRIVLYVDDIDTTIAALRKADIRFRNEVEVGPGGKQVQVEDPDGNPIELHEAPQK